jgi:hypothetical protein
VPHDRLEVGVGINGPRTGCIGEAGATGETAMPSGPRASASERIAPMSAPLLVTYGNIDGSGGAQSVSDVTKMIRPAMPGVKAWASQSGDSRFTANTCRSVVASRSASVA